MIYWRVLAWFVAIVLAHSALWAVSSANDEPEAIEALGECRSLRTVPDVVECVHKNRIMLCPLADGRLDLRRCEVIVFPDQPVKREC